jgi:hypothetical protein
MRVIYELGDFGRNYEHPIIITGNEFSLTFEIGATIVVLTREEIGCLVTELSQWVQATQNIYEKTEVAK